MGCSRSAVKHHLCGIETAIACADFGPEPAQAAVRRAGL